MKLCVVVKQFVPWFNSQYLACTQMTHHCIIPVSQVFHMFLFMGFIVDPAVIFICRPMQVDYLSALRHLKIGVNLK